MCPLKNDKYKHMKKVLLFLVLIGFMSCKETTVDKRVVDTTDDNTFVFASWAHADGSFDKTKWETKLASYDSLGISELLIGGSPKFYEQLIPLASEKNIKIIIDHWVGSV